MDDILSRLTLLRATVGLQSPTEAVPLGVDAQWLTPGIKDLLLVSLDVESKVNSCIENSDLGYIFHCGISILDNRALCGYSKAIALANRDTAHTKLAPPKLDTYHFSVGNAGDPANKKYLDKRHRCKYNTEHHMTTSSAVTRIHEILDSRPFVLVTHGGYTDYRFWNTLHIDREPPWTIDTGAIVHSCYPDNFSSKGSPTLKVILNFLRIPYGKKQLHVAGYDAFFTLRALLLMAAHYANVTELKKYCSPEIDWRATQQALLDIGDPSPAEKAGNWVKRSMSTRIAKKALKHLRTPANRPLLHRLRSRDYGVRKSPRTVTRSGSEISRRLTRSVTTILFGKKHTAQVHILECSDPTIAADAADAVSNTIDPTGDVSLTGCGTSPGAPVNDTPDSEQDILSSDIPELRIITSNDGLDDETICEKVTQVPLQPPVYAEKAQSEYRTSIVPLAQPFRGETAPWSSIIRSLVGSASTYTGKTCILSSEKVDGQNGGIATTEEREATSNEKPVVGTTTPTSQIHSPRPVRPPRPIEWPSLPHVRLSTQSRGPQPTFNAGNITGLSTLYPAAPVQTAPSHLPSVANLTSLDRGCDLPFETPQTNPSIYRATKSFSPSAPFLISSTDGTRPCCTGDGQGSTFIQEFPSIDAAVSQKECLGRASAASVAPVVQASYLHRGSDAQQQTLRSHSSGLPSICTQHTDTPSNGGEGPPVSDADSPDDSLHRSLQAGQHGPPPTVPGNIYLVPAGLPVPFHNALITARPLTPVKDLNPNFTKSMRKWKKALGRTAPDLTVVAKLRRSHNLLLRAIRSFEKAHETGTKEYKVMAVVNKQRVEKLGMDTSAVFGNGPLSDLNIPLLEEGVNAHGVDGGGETDDSLGLQAFLLSGSRKRKRDEANFGP